MSKRDIKEVKRYNKLVNLELDSDVVCEKCGKKTSFYPGNHHTKILCSWCHNYVFVNESEEFKYRLKEKMNGL